MAALEKAKEILTRVNVFSQDTPRFDLRAARLRGRLSRSARLRGWSSAMVELSSCAEVLGDLWILRVTAVEAGRTPGSRFQGSYVREGLPIHEVLDLMETSNQRSPRIMKSYH